MTVMFICNAAMYSVNATSDSKDSYRAIAAMPIQIGAYYYKLSDNRVMRSTKEESGYRRINSKYTSSAFTNGKTVYAVECKIGMSVSSIKKCTLVKYSVSGKGHRTIKSLPKKKDNEKIYWYIGCISGNNIILGGIKTNSFSLLSYKYNIKSDKLKIASNRYAPIESISGDMNYCGKYFLTEKQVNTDGRTPGRIYLSKITSSGKLTKIKGLGYTDAAFVDKKLYYVRVDISYESYEDLIITVGIYKSNYDGNQEAMLGTKQVRFSNYSGTVRVRASEFNTDYCSISIGDDLYHFFYDTGSFEMK